MCGRGLVLVVLILWWCLVQLQTAVPCVMTLDKFSLASASVTDYCSLAVAEAGKVTICLTFYWTVIIHISVVLICGFISLNREHL